MEKIEIAYSKRYYRNRLLIIFTNFAWGIYSLVSGSLPSWLGYFAFILGIVLIVFYAYEKRRKYHIILENGILKIQYVFRTREYLLKGLQEVEKSKDSLLLIWEDKKEEINTHQIEEEGKSKLYSSLRFFISNS